MILASSQGLDGSATTLAALKIRVEELLIHSAGRASEDLLNEPRVDSDILAEPNERSSPLRRPLDYGIMVLKYTKHEKISLKSSPEFGEAWLQERISDDPTILRLGDVDLLDRERNQGPGRLDLLLQDSELNKRYEVELMLGAKYPSSEHAALVKDKRSELAEIVGESRDESINNAVAQSYLRHAEFWSEDKDSAFRIDSSWIPNVESAVNWYDKVIAEFPKSPAAERAYRGKLRTLLGWEESGRYGDSHGVKGNFKKYMPLLLEAFSSFEADFPQAGSLQAFRYQIAQGYWTSKDWERTREWLNRIITIAGDSEGFYKDLAQRRLRKVEY